MGKPVEHDNSYIDIAIIINCRKLPHKVRGNTYDFILLIFHKLNQLTYMFCKPQ